MDSVARRQKHDCQKTRGAKQNSAKHSFVFINIIAIMIIIIIMIIIMLIYTILTIIIIVFIIITIMVLWQTVSSERLKGGSRKQH